MICHQHIKGKIDCGDSSDLPCLGLSFPAPFIIDYKKENTEMTRELCKLEKKTRWYYQNSEFVILE